MEVAEKIAEVSGIGLPLADASPAHGPENGLVTRVIGDPADDLAALARHRDCQPDLANAGKRHAALSTVLDPAPDEGVRLDRENPGWCAGITAVSQFGRAHHSPFRSGG